MFYSTRIAKNGDGDIVITVFDTLDRSNILGTATVNNFDDILLDLPWAQGQFRMKRKAMNQFRINGIKIDDLLDDFNLAMIKEGDYILRNLRK